MDTNKYVKKLLKQPKKYKYQIVWKTKDHGREVVDEFDTEQKAKQMKKQYKLAFVEGQLYIRKRKEQF